MSAEKISQSPLETSSSLSERRTFSRREAVKNTVRAGAGVVAALSFYKTSTAVKDIDEINNSIANIEYNSNRTPLADPNEAVRLRESKGQLTQEFSMALGALVVSGGILLADLRSHKTDQDEH